ncbi:TIGR01440 family protein [Anaerobacillus alkaliphilus]|uniref:UPF0340 protein DS745_05175 n=1 Tax=Anaerobacillus alkaliphilus TaxID=1548597 RepID=A0A4Q0VVA9_9BACI|nr:TIGR01440 family protein [Anaerobacillus alkaliphilus]RXJ02707.1 TIGR01440 family protein [Anaerobacillus alkaliphilus]
MSEIFEQVSQALVDLDSKKRLTDEHILVIGTSTSEVIGEHIGTSGTKEVAEAIFQGVQEFQKRTGVHLAFQCCEHLNRALVVEDTTRKVYGLEPVSVIPVPKAGGSMAAFAYSEMKNPVVVEFIKADAGIDIGDTLIGMHLKHVAVPVRSKVRMVGQAHLTLAVTRPKLIGGARAVYELQAEEGNCN